MTPQQSLVPQAPVLFSHFRRRVTRTQRRRRIFKKYILPLAWAARARAGLVKRWLRQRLPTSGKH